MSFQTPSERRCAYALVASVRDFIDRHGVECCGFLTITFADDLQWTNPKDWAEARRRWKSLIGHNGLSSIVVDRPG